MRWAVSERGKPQPFDAAPNPEGNRRFEDRGGVYKGLRVPTAVPHDGGQRNLLDDDIEVFMPHHATCEFAHLYRKDRQ